MKQQTGNSEYTISPQNLNPTQGENFFADFLGTYLAEPSRSKATVKYAPATPAAAVDSLLGAMLAGGSLEVMPPLFKLLRSKTLSNLQQLRARAGMTSLFARSWHYCAASSRPSRRSRTGPRSKKCSAVTAAPGRTSGQPENFRRTSENAAALNVTPPELALNLDPHFVDRAPQHRNQEIKRIIGRRDKHAPDRLPV